MGKRATSKVQLVERGKKKIQTPPYIDVTTEKTKALKKKTKKKNEKNEKEERTREGGKRRGSFIGRVGVGTRPCQTSSREKCRRGGGC